MKIRSTCLREAIPFPLTAHRSVKFLRAFKAGQAPCLWQAALQTEHGRGSRRHSCQHFSLTQISNWFRHAKKISKFYLLTSTSAYQYFPFPEKGWVTRQDHENGPLSGKVFPLRKQRDLLKEPHLLRLV